MSGRFSHRMPFGAELQDDQTVRFQLWAPSRHAVALILEDQQRILPLTQIEDGFFALTTDAAHAGSRYRFQLEDGTRVPDPASRHQPEDVHGPSEVIDPRAYAWQNAAWRGRPWHETVLYELHVGAFTEQGTFDGVRRKLDHLAELGITAIELMPLSEFPGARNWGYDGVMPFAPDAAYGRPEDLKRLIDEAHGRELMVFLDVVYNHFGPEGNYLNLYADSFFEPEEHTPWGAAIDYQVRAVRDFALHNVLFWLEEYRFDGLRFDAVDRIIDRGEEHILKEIAATVRRAIPAETARPSGARERPQPGAPAGARRRRAAGLLRRAVERRHPSRLSSPAERRRGGLLRRLCHRRAPAPGQGADLGLRLPGRRLALPQGRPARRAERSSAADRVRRLHPKSRSDRQPRVRRADRRSGAARGGPGDAGGPSARAQHPAAVHGRGVGRDPAVLLLHRFPRRARRCRARGTPAGVQQVPRVRERRGARPHSGSERPFDLCGIAPGLVRTRSARACGLARAGARAAAHPARRDRAAARRHRRRRGRGGHPRGHDAPGRMETGRRQHARADRQPR